MGKPLVDGFGAGLFEVRTSYDKKEYRVLFCIEGDTMLLLHGLQKKTQKTRLGISLLPASARKGADHEKKTHWFDLRLAV